MFYIRKWVKDSLLDLRHLRFSLGHSATFSDSGTDSSLGKRQTLFEKMAFALILKRVECLPFSVTLQAEGYQVIHPLEDWIVGLDQTDGTAGDARFGGVGQLATGLPVSCVLAVRENVRNPTFASVKYAGILNLRDGQIFVASEDGALVIDGDGLERSLVRVSQYNIHAPAVAVEIGRRANAFLRYLIPYGVYPEAFADSHSSAMVMLWALLGYCDVWLNCNLPGITGAGQRGHELGALSVFARALEAYAVQTAILNNKVVVVGSLDDAPYTFDEQTSVILGVDEQIVRHYLDLVNRGLSRAVKLRGGTLTIAEVLGELYKQYPDERWSLPLVMS